MILEIAFEALNERNRRGKISVRGLGHTGRNNCKIPLKKRGKETSRRTNRTYKKGEGR